MLSPKEAMLRNTRAFSLLTGAIGGLLGCASIYAFFPTLAKYKSPKIVVEVTQLTAKNSYGTFHTSGESNPQNPQDEEITEFIARVSTQAYEQDIPSGAAAGHNQPLAKSKYQLGEKILTIPKENSPILSTLEPFDKNLTLAKLVILGIGSVFCLCPILAVRHYHSQEVLNHHTKSPASRLFFTLWAGVLSLLFAVEGLNALRKKQGLRPILLEEKYTITKSGETFKKVPSGQHPHGKANP